MSNNIHDIDISREAFMSMSPADREGVIFDCLKSISEDVKDLKEKEKINKKEIIWLGGVFGFLGGVLVTVARFFLP